MYQCTIRIISASDLPLKKKYNYPYIKIDFESTDKNHTTRNIKKTPNPTWDEEAEFELSTNQDAILISVYQKGDDEDLLIGSVDYDLEMLENPDQVTRLELELDEGGIIEIAVLLLEEEEAAELAAFKGTMFFQHLKQDRKDIDIERDYIVIVDKSTSMSKGNRWDEARQALYYLTPFVCQADPDGITLYFFSETFKAYYNVTSEKKVKKLFAKQKLSAGTGLTSVLQAAFREHFSGDTNTTILIITDGAPNSKRNVEKVITKAANKVKSQEELSLTFIQIGNSRGAREFLEYLDDDIDCKHDIVDTITCESMKKMDFSKLIYLSVTD